jgi:glycosyltransferase involved in cell wall biosynthesis
MKGDNFDTSKAEVSVIIMTLNEEENIEQCLKSMYGWSDDIHIVDSHSTDKTTEIAKKYTNNIYSIEEGHWSYIRNWALSNMSLKYEWVLHIDADEWLTKELKDEISQKINSDPDEIGFYSHIKFIFLNKWLKHGGQRFKKIILFKHDEVRYAEKGDDNYTIFKGKAGLLKNDFVHQDLKPFSAWIDKHNKISLRAAKRYSAIKEGKKEFLPKVADETIDGRLGLQKIWNRVPLLLKPFLMFFYIYFIKLGFLDGREGLIYYLHHAFWYELLIYTKIKEMEIERVKYVKGKG